MFEGVVISLMAGFSLQQIVDVSQRATAILSSSVGLQGRESDTEEAETVSYKNVKNSKQ